MNESQIILERLFVIEELLKGQAIQEKKILNFNDACKYLNVSASFLYKLTSTRQIPHYCPQGKKLYFNREELDAWVQRNRTNTSEEVDQIASNYIIKRGRIS